jgi:hypothetical protein
MFSNQKKLLLENLIQKNKCSLNINNDVLFKN